MWLSHSLTALSHNSLSTTTLYKSEAHKTKASSLCSPVVCASYPEDGKRLLGSFCLFFINTWSAAQGNPLLGLSHRVCERFRKLRSLSYKSHFKINWYLPNWKWAWEIYKHILSSIKQHLQFLCSLYATCICLVSETRILQYNNDNELHTPFLSFTTF